MKHFSKEDTTLSRAQAHTCSRKKASLVWTGNMLVFSYTGSSQWTYYEELLKQSKLLQRPNEEETVFTAWRYKVLLTFFNTLASGLAGRATELGRAGHPQRVLYCIV